MGPQRGFGRFGGQENLLLLAEFYIAYIKLKNKQITIKLYYTRILYNVWKQLHVSAFFLGHHQVVHTSLIQHS